MTCNPSLEFSVGGTLADGKVIDSDITNANLKGDITADAATWQQIAEGVAPHIPPPVIDPTAVANVFRDSLGNPLLPGVKLVMSQELAAAVLLAVASVYKNKDNLPLSPGTQLLSASEIEDAIQLAICNLPSMEGAKITAFQWNVDKTTLTITETDDGGPHLWPVDFTDFVKTTDEVPGPAPDDDVGFALPAKVYGARTALLGEPATFLKKKIGSVNYLLPLYALP
jgi:hypothetical protein